MRRITLVVIVLVIMWTIAVVLVGLLTCLPVASYWDPAAYPDHRCLPNLPWWYITAAGSIASDLIIFALPIPVLWQLHLPKRQRVSLIGIFGFGFL